MEVKHYFIKDGHIVDANDPSDAIHAIPTSGADHVGITYTCDKSPEYSTFYINYTNNENCFLTTTEPEGADPDEFFLYCQTSNEYLSGNEGSIEVNGSGTYEIINNQDLGVDRIILTNEALEDSELHVTVRSQTTLNHEVEIELVNNESMIFYSKSNTTWDEWIENELNINYVFNGWEFFIDQSLVRIRRTSGNTTEEYYLKSETDQGNSPVNSYDYINYSNYFISSDPYPEH